jgi:hypothetical protein
MAEIEANRDYYGPVRFDDINFQMSAQGQQLQARFVETYADRLHDQIEGELTLPEFAPVSRPGVAGQAMSARAVPVVAADQAVLVLLLDTVGDQRRGARGPDAWPRADRSVEGQSRRCHPRRQRAQARRRQTRSKNGEFQRIRS